jgi:hypothetical protein
MAENPDLPAAVQQRKSEEASVLRGIHKEYTFKKILHFHVDA